MADNYDLIVLGSGNAGMGVAGVAREAGQSVVMIESWDVGGTCPIRGCVPKKVLVAAAQVLHQIDLAKEHFISVGPPKVDWAKLIEREQGFVEGVPDMFASSLENRGIKLVKGEAKFTGANEVAVDGRTLTGKKIVIATGSKPRKLPIPGFEHTITSDEILIDRTAPDSITFIGGGVIALEFGHVYARAGIKVTILEVLPQLLPRFEPDLVAELVKETRRIGIDVVTGVTVEKIAKNGKGLTVHYQHDGKAETVTSDVVANGAGRVAHVEGLDLEAAGIDHDGPAIKVDEYLRSTSNADVFVAGDALVGAAQLSPIASYEGRLVGHNISNNDMKKADYTGMPACVFTVPAIGIVGPTEQEAKAKGLKFEAKVNDMATWRSAKSYAETVSWAKVLVEEGSGKILAAHMIGHGAEELIHLFAMAINHGIPASELAGGVYAYPTFTSDIKFLV